MDIVLVIRCILARQAAREISLWLHVATYLSSSTPPSISETPPDDRSQSVSLSWQYHESHCSSFELLYNLYVGLDKVDKSHNTDSIHID